MKTTGSGRARWAAIGAAVAVTFGAGGMWVSHAASEASSVVMIEPARVLDTRDGTDLGLTGPFVSPVSQDLQITGEIPTATGDATVVPAGATGVLLNVTPVRSTADGFISIRPADSTGSPTTSSLNFVAGATNPNSVQVAVPTTGADAGKIEITYDALGVSGPTTDILVDVVGYTVPSNATEVQLLREAIAAIDAAQPFAETTRFDGVTTLTAIDQQVLSVTVVAPVDGELTVMSTISANEDFAGDEVRCSITEGSELNSNYLQRWESGGPNTGQHGQLSGVRTYTVSPGLHTINLVCDHVGPGSPNSDVEAGVMTAIFTPSAGESVCDRIPGVCTVPDGSLPPVDM